MNYNNICTKYSFQIDDYVNRISSTYQAIATSGHGTINSSVYSSKDTNAVLENCINEFAALLEKDYKDASRREIEEMVLSVFENKVFPRVKSKNQRKASNEANKEMFSEAAGTIIFFTVGFAIIALLSKILG